MPLVLGKFSLQRQRHRTGPTPLCIYMQPGNVIVSSATAALVHHLLRLCSILTSSSERERERESLRVRVCTRLPTNNWYQKQS
jgi:hypothetical protein